MVVCRWVVDQRGGEKWVGVRGMFVLRNCWLFLGRSFPASAGSVRSELVSACLVFGA